jgi:hypothetical protein
MKKQTLLFTGDIVYLFLIHIQRQLWKNHKKSLRELAENRIEPIRSSVDEQRARDIKHDAMIFGAGVWHHARRMKPSKRWSGAYLLVIE